MDPPRTAADFEKYYAQTLGISVNRKANEICDQLKKTMDTTGDKGMYLMTFLLNDTVSRKVIQELKGRGFTISCQPPEMVNPYLSLPGDPIPEGYKEV